MDIYQHRNDLFIPANDLRTGGNIEQAIAAYTDAIDALDDIENYDYVLENYLSRGLAYRAKGMFPQALADYDEAVRLVQAHTLSRYAADLEAYVYRANARAVMGNLAGALADHQQALKMDAKHDSAKLDLFCVHPSDLQLAIADCNQVLAINPSAATFYYFRGMARQVVGEFSLAMDDYDMALASSADEHLNSLSKRHVRYIQEKMNMVNPFDSDLMIPNMDYARVSLDGVSQEISMDEFDVETHERRSYEGVQIDDFRQQLESDGWNLTGTHVTGDGVDYYYQRHKK